MAETGAAADVDIMQVQAGPNLTTFQRIKAILGGSAGNMVEWYDWFAYTSFSLYFASSFFPSGNPTAQLLAAQIPNVVSFFARPFGALVMGWFADKFGRKTALVVAVLMMCVGALLLACAPTAATVGGLAPWLLGAARLIQGLSVGGQYGAAATYMSEMATRQRRGFWSSFHYVTLIGGQLLAILVLMGLQAAFTEAELKQWAWRIAFFIGAALAIIVFFVQNSLHETESYHKAKASGEKSHPFQFMTKYPRETLAIFGLTAAGTSGFYAYTTYMLKFLQAPHGGAPAAFTKPEATRINFITLLVFMCAQPLFGHLADKFGRKAMLIFGFGLGAIAAYPVFSGLAASPSFGTAVILCIIPALLLSGYTSISAVVKAELFPAHIRALGVAFPYALANAVFGSLVETSALGWKADGHENYFYYYIAGLMVVGTITAILLRDTKKHSRILED